jgi:hypothetical protein
MLEISLIFGYLAFFTIILVQNNKLKHFEYIVDEKNKKLQDYNFLERKISELERENNNLLYLKKIETDMKPFIDIEEKDEKDWYKNMYRDMIGTLRYLLNKKI